MKGARIFVIIPAYAEEERIGRTLLGIPSWISGIVVVDDASPDATAARALAMKDPRVTVVQHPINRGVGRAIATGYQHALRLGAEILVVMAGDNQMDPEDLPRLLTPLLDGRADYVKGNRFLHPDVRHMPLHRRLGSRLLARLTNAVGGTTVDDSQCGYTALSRHAALHIDWDALWERYGYPNDLLIALARRGFRIVEVPVRPVYAGEKSGLRPWHLLTIMAVIARRAALERQRGVLERQRGPSLLHTTQGAGKQPARARAPFLAEGPTHLSASRKPKRAVANTPFQRRI